MFKNLSQFKKGLNKGMKFEMIKDDSDRIFHKEIHEVQSNGVWLKDIDQPERNPSWFNFPKANRISFHESGFVIDDFAKFRLIS